MRCARMVSALVCSIALASTAYAGDKSWTGAYAGIHGGYAWGNLDGTLTVEGVNPNDHFPPSAARSIDEDGAYAGLQLGYNLQSANFVYGLEADFSAGSVDGNLSATTQSFGPWGSYTKNIETKLEMFATLRGRAGLLLGPALIYATGGLAWADTDGDQTVFFNPGPQNGNGPSVRHAYGTGDDSKFGWTIGGGAEVPLGGKWSLKGEYLYMDFGSVTYRFIGTYAGDPYHGAAVGDPHTSDGFKGDIDFQTLRVGLNYKLD